MGLIYIGMTIFGLFLCVRIMELNDNHRLYEKYNYYAVNIVIGLSLLIFAWGSLGSSIHLNHVYQNVIAATHQYDHLKRHHANDKTLQHQAAKITNLKHQYF